MLIDFHTHCFPDQLAAAALNQMRGIIHANPFTDGTCQDLLKKMEDWKIDMAVCLHVASTPVQQYDINEFALSINNKNKLFSFGSVHAASPDAIYEIYRLHESGIRGIKLHPDGQQIDILDRRMFPIYDTCAELNMPCVFHSGWDPISPKETRVTPDKILRIKKFFPHFSMILGHLGGLGMWDEVENRLAGTGIMMDTAYTCGLLSPEQMTRIIHKHGAEHILFGSDCPWQNSRDVADFIDSLDISSAEKDLIFYKNALRLLHIHE